MIFVDSWRIWSSIHEGVAQCSAGMTSEAHGQRLLWAHGVRHSLHTIDALGLCCGACLSFELFREWLIVEEGPWIVELVVPCSFEIAH